MTTIDVSKNPEHLTMTMTAVLDVDAKRAWELWSDPRQLERWWGPPSHPATVEEHDLSEGGTVTYFMTGPEGERTRGWWRVTAAEPPRALEFTDGFADADGAPNADLPTTTVRVRLAERDGTTRMELRFTFASGEHMAMLERWGAFDVFPQSVAQMDAIVAGSA